MQALLHVLPCHLTPPCAAFLHGVALVDELQEERGTAERLKTAYRQLFAQAMLAEERGEANLAASLRRRAVELQEEYQRESVDCGTRITQRVNRGKHRGIEVDLHCMHVHQALDMVDTALRNLPLIFPGGVVVRYITGKGLHSENGAKIRPAVLSLLQEAGVPYVAWPGCIDVTIGGGTA